MAYCGAVEIDLQTEMRKAVTVSDPNQTLNMNLNTMQKQLSQTLYYILVMLMEDGALKKLEHVGEGEGLRAWRKLNDDFEPDVGGRHAGKLIQLMNTSFSGADIMSQLDGFETECNRWEAQSMETFSDTMRIAVVQKGLDDDGYVANLVSEGISRLGCVKLILKGDDKIATQAFIRRVIDVS